MEKTDIKSLDYDELKDFFVSIGEKPFRAKQVYQWIHEKQADGFEEMTNLSKNLREKLAETCEYTCLENVQTLVSELDGTRKYLFRLSDGYVVESVLMRYQHGNSVCISTQVGCRMGCRFCASTIGGKTRDLTAGEMLDQIYRIQKDIGERVSNLVMMGTGEPLDNYDNAVKFIRMLSDEHGLNISQRNITLSTCGIVPRMRQLADEGFQITLALSLHAPNQEKRKALLPIAGKYEIHEAVDACRYYYEKTGRRITFEYSLVGGQNDSKEDAKQLYELIHGINCHVNLIPVNPVKERSYVQSERKVIVEFKNKLENCGINVTIRREMGRDIGGACGQLRKSYMDKEKRSKGMRSCCVTDVGQKRTTNQDFVFASDTPVGPLPNLLIVADGMGGHQAGDMASRYAAEVIVSHIKRSRERNPIRVLRSAIETANERVLEKAAEDEELSGMGTTVVAATVVENYLYVANVGDSRLYLIRDHIRQITRDHSLVGEMVRAGELSPEQARNHPNKNIITRAVGAGQKLEIDFFDEDLRKGDILLLCSDGLSNMVEDEEIEKIIKSGRELPKIAMDLIERANRNGGKDNIAVVLAQPLTGEVEQC